MKAIVTLMVFTCLLMGCNFAKKEHKKVSISTTKSITVQDPLKESMERGGVIYSNFCLQCHMADGKGVQGTFPPLAMSNWLEEKRTESIRAIKYGQIGAIEVNGEVYNSVMVAMGLTDDEIADVLNYVMNSWGNTQNTMVTETEVSKVFKE